MDKRDLRVMVNLILSWSIITALSVLILIYVLPQSATIVIIYLIFYFLGIKYGSQAVLHGDWPTRWFNLTLGFSVLGVIWAVEALVASNHIISIGSVFGSFLGLLIGLLTSIFPERAL